VGNITASNAHMTARAGTDGTAGSRARLPEIADRTTVAIESLRTQWRTITNLGTHERMAVAQLRIYGPMPMSELASRISLSRAAVTSLVDRLEADGWVRREADEQDRRRTVLRLLPRAGDEFDAVSEPWRRELLAIADSMSDDEWRTVRTFLSRVGDIAERQANDLRSTAIERSLT
jgi:DNA-binding MarR family transcriptional regulator